VSGLAVRALRVSRAGRVVVSDVSFTVDAGRLLALMGPSGAGKTTLLRALAGLEPIAGGRVSLDDAPVPRRAGAVGFVFQDLALWPHLSAERQVRWAAEAAGNTRDAALATLRECGAEAFAGRRPGHLSGGERRRVALARALAGSPCVLLLDEPFSGLDVPLALELADLVRARARARGIPVVAAVHAPYEARALGDGFAVLEAGNLSGPCASLEQLDAAPGSWLDRCRRHL
jgi:ABC-type sulfate/molybdate transport systems ATPase subunit